MKETSNLKPSHPLTRELPQRGSLCKASHSGRGGTRSVTERVLHPTVKPQFKSHILSPSPCHKHGGETAGSRRPPTSMNVGVTSFHLERCTPAFGLSPPCPKSFGRSPEGTFRKSSLWRIPRVLASPVSPHPPLLSDKRKAPHVRPELGVH